jgi:hypothetical protein
LSAAHVPFIRKAAVFDGLEVAVTGHIALVVLLAVGVEQEAGPWLEAGDYRLHIKATAGLKKGHSVEGLLSLRPTQKTDRSASGQIAKDRRLEDHPFYGWTDAKLTDVGAPMPSGGGPAPTADSRDPVYPGVLVDTGWKPNDPRGRPRDAPILWVGSFGNLRDDSSWTDGPGIVMFVMKRSQGCLLGVWEEAGIGGPPPSGTFSLCPE